MDPAARRREIERFNPNLPIEEAATPPSSWYTAPALYELERRAVFARSWQPVARVEQLITPGSYISGCLAGEPWVVTRGDDGALRAFHNVCRHKGHAVAHGSGRAERFVCGYHGWTYTLRGRLERAPRVAGIRDFDRAATSLAPMQVDTWGPWVFINADREAPPVRARVPELDAFMQTTGWEQLRFVERRVWTLECNWKVYVDNYLDGGYHIPLMHPTLNAQLDMGSYKTIPFSACSIQTSAPASVGDGRLDDAPGERIGDGATYAWIYPNFMLNRYGPCLDSNHVIPLGPDRCQVVYEFFFRETEGERARGFIARSVAQADITQREDIEICESVQVGLRSASYDQGRYAPRVELGEHHFHRLLAADLRAHA
ncbi:MAG: aromatic ring-hydroxylating dioxygenase subunit alpha [Myxococcales bacterium]|nr:aromatic ring-hydroxylating dioxygenase subunit alpha [Myxococcales bacterium]